MSKQPLNLAEIFADGDERMTDEQFAQYQERGIQMGDRFMIWAPLNDDPMWATVVGFTTEHVQVMNVVTGNRDHLQIALFWELQRCGFWQPEPR